MEYTEGEQCSERVSPNDKWGAFHSHPCSIKAVVERDGKPYCKIHDPEYVKAKREISQQKYEKEMNYRMAERIAGGACHKINPDNPLSVAQSIEDMYEALKEVYNGDLDQCILTVIRKALAKAESI